MAVLRLTLSRFSFTALLLTTTLCGGMFLAGNAQADSRYGGRYDGVNITRGTVYSIGRADPTGSPPKVGGIAPTPFESGILLDANYSSVFLNGGVGTKDFNGHRVANIYAGFGVGRILQLQAGIGDRGPLGRIRTDLNLREAFNFVTQSRQARRERTLADRVTFTYSVERYSDDNNGEFNNGTIGVGVLFDGPF